MPTQAQYSTFDRELFAAVRHFRFLLESLVAAMQRTTPLWSSRQQRHLSFLSEFTSDLWHASGHTNVVADALSQPPPVSAATVFKPPAIALPLQTDLHTSNPAVEPLPPAFCTTAEPPPASPAPPLSPTAEQPFNFAAVAAAQEGWPDIIFMQASPSLCIISRPVGKAGYLYWCPLTA
jgi:hypothetical protein